MRLIFNKKIVAGFIGCACILIASAVISFRNSEKFITTNLLVNYTQEVINQIEQTLVICVDAETGMRGYVITGQENFLEPYKKSKTRMKEHILRLRELTRDNPVQQKNMDS